VAEQQPYAEGLARAGAATVALQAPSLSSVSLALSQLAKVLPDPAGRNALVLNTLADHRFHAAASLPESERAAARRDSLALAAAAYQRADEASVRAESCYIIGRTYHSEARYGLEREISRTSKLTSCWAQGDYDNAFAFYSRAVKLGEHSALAQFGLGQMHLHRGPPARLAVTP
jgi:hypothetical protein